MLNNNELGIEEIETPMILYYEMIDGFSEM
jgi:hypothetical protein